jgi:hypothetical protein
MSAVFQNSSLLPASIISLLVFLFDHEGGDTFLRIVEFSNPEDRRLQEFPLVFSMVVL